MYKYMYYLMSCMHGSFCGVSVVCQTSPPPFILLLLQHPPPSAAVPCEGHQEMSYYLGKLV